MLNMLLKTYFKQNSPDAWTHPRIELHVDYDPVDGSVADYKLYLVDANSIDITKLFTNNWPVLVMDMIQETDWDEIYQHDRN